jgi:hypothetical protein
MGGRGRRASFRFQPGQALVDFPEVVFNLGELFGFSFLPEIEQRPFALEKSGDN